MLRRWEISQENKIKLKAVCPNCGAASFVYKAWLYSEPKYKTRPCTYCFKVAKI